MPKKVASIDDMSPDMTSKDMEVLWNKYYGDLVDPDPAKLAEIDMEAMESLFVGYVKSAVEEDRKWLLQRVLREQRPLIVTSVRAALEEAIEEQLKSIRARVRAEYTEYINRIKQLEADNERLKTKTEKYRAERRELRKQSKGVPVLYYLLGACFIVVTVIFLFKIRG